MESSKFGKRWKRIRAKFIRTARHSAGQPPEKDPVKEAFERLAESRSRYGNPDENASADTGSGILCDTVIRRKGIVPVKKRIPCIDRNKIAAALEQIPEEERIPFKLKMEGYGYFEIAYILDEDPFLIRKKIRQTRKKLSRRINARENIENAGSR